MQPPVSGSLPSRSPGNVPSAGWWFQLCAHLCLSCRPPALVSGEHGGQSFPFVRRESEQHGGQLVEPVPFVGPFGFVAAPVGGLRRRAGQSSIVSVGVIVFRFAGANPGANWRRRRRKALQYRGFGIVAIWFGTRKSKVQILSPRLTFLNDLPSKPEPIVVSGGASKLRFPGSAATKAVEPL